MLGERSRHEAILPLDFRRLWAKRLDVSTLVPIVTEKASVAVVHLKTFAQLC